MHVLNPRSDIASIEQLPASDSLALRQKVTYMPHYHQPRCAQELRSMGAKMRSFIVLPRKGAERGGRPRSLGRG